jgi:hypothetical protein
MTGGMWCFAIAVVSALALIGYLLKLRHEDLGDDR